MIVKKDWKNTDFFYQKSKFYNNKKWLLTKNKYEIS